MGKVPLKTCLDWDEALTHSLHKPFAGGPGEPSQQPLRAGLEPTPAASSEQRSIPNHLLVASAG